MFCRYCGNMLSNDAVFCSKCGRQQNTTVEIPGNTSQVSPILPLQNRIKKEWLYLLGGGIVLIVTILLYLGTIPKPSPELPEIPETPQSSRTYNDVSRYQCYATAFWQGSSGLSSLPSDQCAFLGSNTFTTTKLQVTQSPTIQPFHTLPIEYPFLSLAVFSPALITTQVNYQTAFEFEMLLIVGIIYLVLQRYRSTQAGIAFIIYLVLGSWATAMGRFDLAPAALTVGAIIFAGKTKWNLAFSLLALATLLKFYPVMLTLPFLIAQQSHLKGSWISWQRWKAFGIFICICIAITLISSIMTLDGTLNPIHYFVDRPIQVESLPATILWLGNFVGYSADYAVSFQSFNFVGPLSLSVGIVSTLCLIVGVIYVSWLQWHGNIDMSTASLLTILIILATGKVFSAQYIMWATPLVAYVGKCNWKWLISWGGICLFTTVIFPYMYTDLNFVKAYYPVILLRNAWLIAFLGTLLYRATFSRLSVHSQHNSTFPYSIFVNTNGAARFVSAKISFLRRR